jgi:hypothetical protein
MTSGMAVRRRTSEDPSDRRRFRRWPVIFPVVEVGPHLHVLRAVSLGAGGLFCPHAAPRSIGELVELEIDLLAEGGRVRTVACVVHAGRGGDGLGLGLAFVEPQQQLADFLDRYWRSSVFAPA